MSVQFIFPLHDFSGVFFGAMVKPTWEINLVCFSDSALQCNCNRSAKIVRINITIPLLRKECFFSLLYIHKIMHFSILIHVACFIKQAIFYDCPYYPRALCISFIFSFTWTASSDVKILNL